MQKVKKDRSKLIQIPALHTFLVKENENICDQITISLLSGSAEINGVEIMKHYPQSFELPCCLPVFTWESCRIQVDWKEEEGPRSSDEEWCDLTQYHSQETPLIKYLQLHYELTCLRKSAQQTLSYGPCLAIVGSEVSGIGSVTKTMLNYAGKLNMKPIFVDLDLDNSIFVHGTVGSMVFEYKLAHDLFDRIEKISFFYGNRKVRKNSYLKLVRLIADSISKKLEKCTFLLDSELKSYKEKGSQAEYCNFSSGIIIQCPRITEREDKKAQKDIIYEIFKIFKVSHVLSIDDSEIPVYLSKNEPKVEKYNLPKFEETSAVLNLAKPNKTRIQRYFSPQITKTIELNIQDVNLYELIEEENKGPYCRKISIKDEPISKSAISVLYCEDHKQQSMEQKAERALNHPIQCLAQIFRIGKETITLNVVSDKFWEENRDKLWLSMISQSH